MVLPILLIIIILVYSIILHEVSHGYVAYRLGDPTAKYEGRLTLNPIAHIDPIGTLIVPLLSFGIGGFLFGWAKPVPYNPYNLRNPRTGSVLIALAGPLTNILLALLFAFLYRLSSPIMPEIISSVLVYAVRINLVLAIFNFLPIPPLDGSKLLLLKISFETYQALELYGFFLILVFIWLFIPYLSLVVNFLQGLLI